MEQNTQKHFQPCSTEATALQREERVEALKWTRAPYLPRGISTM